MTTPVPILIVDDNPSNIKLLSFLLESKGYEVRTAANADEALASIAARRPRLILMDIQLPGMDGLELTRRLKSERTTRQIVVVALTAYAMKGDEARVLAAGCDGYVSKPIDLDGLLRLVGQHVRGEGGRP
jgi:CheY-like chemotaxis protein